MAGSRVTVVGRESRCEERAGGRLDVDDVRQSAALDRPHRLGIQVHLPSEHRVHLSGDRRAAGGEESNPINEPPNEAQRARRAGTGFQPEVESETGAVPLDALQDGNVDLRDAKRCSVVPFGVEEAGEESTSIARAVVLTVEQRVDDPEPRERPDLDLSKRPSLAAIRERSDVGVHAEEPEVLDRAREWLVVDQRNAPVRRRKTEPVATPAGLVPKRPVTERKAAEVPGAVLFVDGRISWRRP